MITEVQAAWLFSIPYLAVLSGKVIRYMSIDVIYTRYTKLIIAATKIIM